MSTVSRSALMAILVLAAAGCARTAEEEGTASAAGARECFAASQVNGFTAIDRDTVHVRVGTRRVYELEIVGVCPEIDWTQRIGIRTTAGGSWICQGLDAELLVPGIGGGVDRCPVTGVRRLGPEEVEAARARRRGD